MNKCYEINAEKLEEITCGLRSIECLLMGIEDIVDRGGRGEVDQEVIRAAVERGLALKTKVAEALPVTKEAA